MDPTITILQIGGLQRPLGSYGLMMATAIIFGTLLASHAAARREMDVGAVIAVIGLTTAGSLLGAYLLFGLVEFARTGDLVAGFTHGGLVFYGAPIGGFLAMRFGAQKLEVPLLELLDIGIPAIPMAHAIGRLGCFLGGCCYGRPWDHPHYAVTATHPMSPMAEEIVARHPVQLYESVLLLVLAWALVLTPLRKVGSGARLGVYLVVYAFIRTLTETFRGDSVRGVFSAGLSTSQLISAIMLAIGAWVIWRARTVELGARPSVT